MKNFPLSGSEFINKRSIIKQNSLFKQKFKHKHIIEMKKKIKGKNSSKKKMHLKICSLSPCFIVLYYTDSVIAACWDKINNVSIFLENNNWQY